MELCVTEFNTTRNSAGTRIALEGVQEIEAASNPRGGWGSIGRDGIGCCDGKEGTKGQAARASPMESLCPSLATDGPISSDDPRKICDFLWRILLHCTLFGLPELGKCGVEC